MAPHVYCTMVLTDTYLAGARVLATALRRLDADAKLVVLATPSTLHKPTVDELYELFDNVELIEPIVRKPSAELHTLGRLDLHSTATKFHLWSLNYDTVVYLDADTLPVQTLAPLFDIEVGRDAVGAAPDAGWPDTFNAGLLVLRPDVRMFDKLSYAFHEGTSFDGADQGVLNEELKWVRLPFVYNATVSTAYEYLPAFNRFASEVRVLHFIGKVKPWDARTGDKFTEMWWQAHDATGASLTPAASPAEDSVSRSIAQALREAETPQPAYDETKVVAPPPDYWDARTHAPFTTAAPAQRTLDPPARQPAQRHEEPGPDLARLALDDSVHVFPSYGPSLVRLPFEDSQAPPERRF